MSNKDNSFEFFLVGFIAGCVSSAIVSILYAPKSGEETRKMIREKSEDFVNSANQSIDRVYKQAEIATNNAVDKFNEFAEIAREQSDAITQRGKKILNLTQDKIKAGAEEIESGIDEILTTGS